MDEDKYLDDGEYFSDLEKNFFYKDEDKKQSVKLGALGVFINDAVHGDYFANYSLTVADGKEEAVVDFGKHKAIINCIYHDYREGSKHHCSMSIKEFNKRFLPVVKRLVPKRIYDEYLKSFDMGEEGIFREEGGRGWL